MDALPLTEAINPSTTDLDRLDTRALLCRINEEDRRAASAVQNDVDAIAGAVDAIVARMMRGGRLHYFGAGTSGRLGILDAAEIPPTFSTDPNAVVGHIAGGLDALTRAVEEAEDDGEAGRAEVESAQIGAGDIAVGISASGAAAFVIGAIQAARALGALTIAITNSSDSPLAAIAEHSIVLQTGPEALTGSTRMKAATAQKMTLTMISTAVMVKLGKVYGNLMVDVRPANKKLRARAERLTKQLTGAPDGAVRDALARCGYRVRIAAVMIASKCGAGDAEATLTEHGGSLRAALGK